MLSAKGKKKMKELLKTRNGKIGLGIVICIVLIIIIVSINSDEKRIIGTWYSEEENQTVCFYEDGTGEVDGIPFEWIILEDKQLKCTFSLFGSEVFDYQITGSKLILEDENEHSEYLKQ